MIKDRVVASTTSLFSHGPQPLANTLDYRGDPGLLGPESVSWEVIGDATAFVGGIRALLVQTAHPEVVAGVEDHSRYRTDPLGRLTRTSFYVTATTYGALPEVERAVAMVNAAHRPVHGTSERGRRYDAADPALAAWVHNVLTDSFLQAFVAFGPRTLSPSERDRFVEEQARVGELLGADPLPRRADELGEWIRDHPDIDSTAAQREAIHFLRRPPLAAPVRLAYRRLFDAAASTIDPALLELLGIETSPRRTSIGGATVTALRWALGASPSWHVALLRSGAPVPPGRFTQPLRVPVSPDDVPVDAADRR